MSIQFELKDKELLFCYTPENGTDFIIRKFEKNESILIKNTFCFTKKHCRSEIDEVEDSVIFCIGTIKDSYIQIDSEVIETIHDFYFDKKIKLKSSMFVAYRNISILKKIDSLIDKDFYIGGEWDKNEGMPFEAFKQLLDLFPKTAELDKYADSRISSILKEYFPESDRYEHIFNAFINKKNLSLNTLGKNETPNTNLKIEYAQFTSIESQLKDMLFSSISIDEAEWQKKIKDIICILYPKYIYSKREVEFEGADKYNKKPDFILVDSNGYIDILEIKKPDVQLLTKQASYRNNYVPVRELAGAIQQIEKYIFCLNSSEKNEKKVIEKLKADKILDNINIKVVNPQGILILGRSNTFNQQQKDDFELVKRQYKNIADIMTYDDLLGRLHNIITTLEKRIAEKITL